MSENDAQSTIHDEPASTDPAPTDGTASEPATRLDALEAAVADLQDEVEDLRAANETLREENEEFRDALQDERKQRREVEGLLEAVKSKTNANDDRLGELQSRELEKDGHLSAETVSPEIRSDRIDVAGDRLVRFEGDDGEEYIRLPGADDPLERSGTRVVAEADLLPIQQLARMPDDVLERSTSRRPDELAARLWRERDKHDRSTVWSRGSRDIQEYVASSDLAVWIRTECPDVNEDYAKKLASRTMDALVDLAQNRLVVQRRRRRQDGLQYTEKRLVLPSDSEIPGEGGEDGAPAVETSDEQAEAAPATAVVDG